MTRSKRAYLINAGLVIGILISYALGMKTRALVEGSIFLFALANSMILAEWVAAKGPD